MARVARNFSFGGCGWNMGYHLGVMTSLQTAGFLDFEGGSRIATASGAAVIGACIASGLSAEDVHAAIVRTNEHNRRLGIPEWYWGLNKVIGNILEELLPDDAHLRVRGRIVIPTQVVWPREKMGDAFHSEFESRADLIHIIIGTCHIPYYSSRNMGYEYNGVYHNDGAACKNYSPDPSTYTLVSCRPFTAFKARACISNPAPILSSVYKMALPHARHRVDESVLEGETAARLWLSQRAASAA